MPTAPNTPAVEAAIQAKCQGLQVAGATFFLPTSVEIGKFKDVTDFVPCCEITLTDDESFRLTLGNGIAQGGKIADSELFLIELTLSLADPIAVEKQLAQIRDALSQAFHTSASLALPGVQYSGWQSDHGGVLKGQVGYADRNGQRWRVYRRKLYVRYDYSTIIVP